MAMLTTKTSLLKPLISKTSRRVGAVVTALLLVGSTSASASVTTAVTWIGQSVATAATSQAGDDRSVEKLLELTPEKSEAFFELLAPNDVKVLVGRRNQGVHVRGTAKEVSTLEAFAELMMRDSHRQITDPQKFIDELEGTWDSASVYKLPKPAGEALLKNLAFADVPVLVANQPDGIGVRASKRDQAVIADIARIQQGMAPKKMHKAPERKVARGEGRGEGRRGGDRAERRRGGDRERADRGRGADRRGRELAEKVERLDERVKKLEELAAALHSGEGHEHAGLHHSDKAHGDHHAKKGDKPKKKKQASKSKGKKKDKKGKKDKPDPNEIVTMRYDLPAQHADNLYNLFAPADIKDILVGRSNNTIEIRAARKHQRTIKQLVKMLSPGSKAKADNQNKRRKQAQTG